MTEQQDWQKVGPDGSTDGCTRVYSLKCTLKRTDNRFLVVVWQHFISKLYNRSEKMLRFLSPNLLRWIFPSDNEVSQKSSRWTSTACKQTNSQQTLFSYKFPQKCNILLGKKKHSILLKLTYSLSRQTPGDMTEWYWHTIGWVWQIPVNILLITVYPKMFVSSAQISQGNFLSSQSYHLKRFTHWWMLTLMFAIISPVP